MYISMYTASLFVVQPWFTEAQLRPPRDQVRAPQRARRVVEEGGGTGRRTGSCWTCQAPLGHSWGFPARHGGIPSSLDGFCEREKSNLKWIVTRGTPIYGNPQTYFEKRLRFQVS